MLLLSAGCFLGLMPPAGLQLEHTPLSKVHTGLDGALVYK
jgi:hypothetical protein